MVCRGYMVDRHYVWCSMVGSVTWDNVQNESHGFENEKYVCVGHSKLRQILPPPRVKDPVLRLDMIIDGESTLKMSKRRAASCGVNLKICCAQMHKHTKHGKCKLISRTVQWILIYKTKSFCFEKKKGH